MAKGGTMEKRIVFVESIKVKVPEDYNHKERLKEFNQKYRQEFSFYDDLITDKNQRKVSYELKPEEECIAKLYTIKHSISSEDLISFLEKQKNVIFPASHGLTVLYENERKRLPQGLIVSFDRKENLWVHPGGSHGVAVLKNQGSSSEFFLGFFEDPWNVNTSVIGFYKNN
ncbi:MAG: hypothetical protein PHG83_01225 [Patescibacteria group bacterium]|nr:hypothetical protein [Patescibacteria group bacterium]